MKLRLQRVLQTNPMNGELIYYDDMMEIILEVIPIERVDANYQANVCATVLRRWTQRKHLLTAWRFRGAAGRQIAQLSLDR